MPAAGVSGCQKLSGYPGTTIAAVPEVGIPEVEMPVAGRHSDFESPEQLAELELMKRLGALQLVAAESESAALQASGVAVDTVELVLAAMVAAVELAEPVTPVVQAGGTWASRLVAGGSLAGYQYTATKPLMSAEPDFAAG